MGRARRQNWALILPLVLVGDCGQVTSPSCVSDFLTYPRVVLPLTSQCGFEEPLTNKMGCEELPEELPE